MGNSRDKKNRDKKIKTIGIIGEGETEKAYFDSLKFVEKESLDNVNLVVKPELAKNSDFANIVKKAQAMIAEGMDYVYVLLDMDVINLKYKNKYEKKQSEYNKANSKYKDKIIFIENNLCFEVWVLYHFEYTNGLQPNCAGYANRIKQHINDYRKNYPNLYKKLKEHLPTALANAEKSQKANPLQAYSQMDKIFKGLGLV